MPYAHSFNVEFDTYSLTHSFAHSFVRLLVQGADFLIPDASGQTAKKIAEGTSNHDLIFCFDPAARKSFRTFEHAKRVASFSLSLADSLN